MKALVFDGGRRVGRLKNIFELEVEIYGWSVLNRIAPLPLRGELPAPHGPNLVKLAAIFLTVDVRKQQGV